MKPLRLLFGGSPCTHWSIAQKNNRETEPEGLGWELFKNYLIAKEKFKPNFFLYENNKSASQPIKDQISKEFGVGVDPDVRFTYINSALVSAQNRNRFYVTNFGDIEQPEDRGILLKDILVTGVIDKEKAYCLKHQAGNIRDYFKKHHTQVACEPVRVGCMPSPNGELKNSQGMRIYSIDGKSVNQTALGGGLGAKTGLYAIPVNTTDDGKSQTIKAQYQKTSTVNVCCYTSTYGATGVAEEIGYATPIEWNENGVPIKAISCADGKTYTVYKVENGEITIKDKQYPIKLPDGYYIIRKLTVVECSRLQTMPDDYCSFGREIVKQIFNGRDDIWENAESRDVITKSQTVLKDCAINIVYDSNDTEQLNLQDQKLIKLKNAKLMVVKDNAKVASASVVCTINDGLDMEILNSLKEWLRCAKFVITLQSQEDCVAGTIKVKKGMETLDMSIVLETDSTATATKNVNILSIKSNIDSLWREKLGENSPQMILFTISTLLSQIMMKVTSTYATSKSTANYTLSLKDVQPNYLEWDILSLKTDIISPVSDSQAYKALGNGWTAEVIIHLLNHALKDVPRDTPLEVLSMYDGIATALYCLKKMGFTNITYKAYEIDKYAKQIATGNHPEIIQCGDAFQIREENWAW